MKPTASSASTTTFLCYCNEELTDCYHHKLTVSGSAPRAVGQHPGCCGDSQGTPPSRYFLPFFFPLIGSTLENTCCLPALRMHDAQQHALAASWSLRSTMGRGAGASSQPQIMCYKCTEGGKCGAGEVATPSLDEGRYLKQRPGS